MACSNLTGGMANPYIEEIYRGLCITGYMFTYAGIPVLALGTVGNILAVAVLLYARSFRKMSFGILLILLSLVDLGVLYTELLRYIVLGLTETQLDLQGLSEAGCKAFEFFRRFFTQLSPWTLVVITTERLISVTLPIRAPQLCQKKWVALTWLIVTLCLVCVNLFHPIAGMLFDVGMDGSVMCQTNSNHSQVAQAYKIYPWVDMCLAALVPGLMILVMNIIIVHRIRRSGHQRRQIARGCGKAEDDSGKTTMLIAIGVLFLVLTLPATIVLTVFSNFGWHPPIEWVVPLEITYKVAILLSVLNNAGNFILYCLAGAKFRHKLLLMFGCRRRQWWQDARSSTFITSLRKSVVHGKSVSYESDQKEQAI